MKLTPGMQQYMDIKNKHPDCIILFRMGDFYETFFEDAKTCARELEITLTARGKGETRAPLAGIPYHSIDPYIAKLIKKGYKVGIVEQTEDPKKAKGLVKRDLVRIITPGTIVESMMLSEGENNYLMAVSKDKEAVSLAVCDMSTGEFLVTQIPEEKLLGEVRRLSPKEIVYPMSLEYSRVIIALKEQQFLLHDFDDRHFQKEKAEEMLKDHFGVANLKGFGEYSELMIQTSGALLSYLKTTQMTSLPHINSLQQYVLDEFMHLDSSTIRNLELVKGLFSDSEDGTLLKVIDHTITPMGRRLLRKWVTAPLKNKQMIDDRLDAVSSLKDDLMSRTRLRESLSNMYDLERLVARVSFGNANPKDLVSLKISLQELPHVRRLLMTQQAPLLKSISSLPDVSSAEDLIESSIKEEPNTTLREGNVIKKGYHEELDELRSIASGGKDFLAKLEEEEREKTGIKSLKIKYNKVFGYFIEVTKSNVHLVPNHYIRKQTQVNAERYITEALKDMEGKILGAEEKSVQLEYDLFMQTLESLKQFISPIQEIAKKLATLDCVISHAHLAQAKNYARPAINEDSVLELEGSRHPVIEALSSDAFIPNDCSLSSESSMMIITGPNMAGKSTYMRQVALVSLLSHIGSFVPAATAKVPVLDRIFTRIGAYDDLVSGQSTFMVEMNEAANILRNATKNSLVIVDEIGRGTSTFDGLSLAFAIAEYLHKDLGAKTLFATHYHHLNQLADMHSGIKNYNIAVEEQDDEIIFLRKIVEGGTDKSYGIQVARLAGVPQPVIDSSKKIMEQFEEKKDRRERDFTLNKFF